MKRCMGLLLIMAVWLAGSLPAAAAGDGVAREGAAAATPPPAELPAELPAEWPAEEAPAQTVEVRTLRPDTAYATEVYIIRSVNPGPAVMIVGGMHGDEKSGWMAAEEIKGWRIDAGTLVVLPKANASAVARGRRTGANGLDLNRQFPVGREPRTALAREIWAVVEEFAPVALLDLHEGWGIYGRHNSVGQTIITYNAGDARQFAAAAVKYLNTYHVRDRNNYRFRVVGPPVAGSLARKAGAELGIPAFIAEATAFRTLQASRVRWHKAVAEEFLRWYGLVTREERIVPKQYRASTATAALQAVPSAMPAASREPATLKASASAAA